MNDALGMLEVKGYVAALRFADVMLKAANVELIEVKKTRGMGWMTLFIQGDVAAVQAAIETAKEGAIQTQLFISAKVIPRPVKGLEQLFKDLEPKEPVKEKVKKDQDDQKKVTETKTEADVKAKTEVKSEVTKSETNKEAQSEPEKQPEKKAVKKPVNKKKKTQKKNQKKPKGS